MEKFKKYFNVIGLILIIIMIILFIAIFQKKEAVPTQTPMPVKIVSSIPLENESSVSVFNPIVITFNQKIDASTIIIISVPSEDWVISQNKINSVTIDHKLFLKVATQYKLDILQDNKNIGSLSFETAHEQNDPRLLQSLQSELDTDYPLASLTPYGTSDFHVVYSAPLTFKISLKSSISSQDAIAQVKSWVESNNIKSDTHKYIIGTTPY